MPANGANDHEEAVAYEGGCQCGKVRYRLSGPLPLVYACHCDACKKQSASAFALSMPVARARLGLMLGGAEHFANQADSGRAKAGHFCGHCGTRLWHESEGADFLTLKAGTLDCASGLIPAAHLWVSRKQPWIRIDSNVPVFMTQPDDLDGWRRDLMAQTCVRSLIVQDEDGQSNA